MYFLLGDFAVNLTVHKNKTALPVFITDIINEFPTWNLLTFSFKVIHHHQLLDYKFVRSLLKIKKKIGANKVFIRFYGIIVGKYFFMSCKKNKYNDFFFLENRQ